MPEQKIFESAEKVGVSEDLMSFDNCPNRCRNGYYVDPYQHRRVRCEHCFELRKKLATEAVQLSDGKGVAEILRLKQTLTGYGNFDCSTLIPAKEQKMLEDWSADFVFSVLKKMLERVSLGEPIACSLYLNLGKNSHCQNFASPFLVKSYISGLTTSPFVTSLDVYRLRRMQYDGFPDDWLKEYETLTYDSLLDTDVCLVYVDAGAHSQDVDAVKGLLQLRALHNKSTIILSDHYSKETYGMLYWLDDFSAQGGGVATNTGRQMLDVVCQLIDGTRQPVRDKAVMVTVNYKKRFGADATEPAQPAVSSGSSELSQEDFASLVGKPQGRAGVAQYNPR